jgi:hydroxypyruvate isomerase
MLKISLCIETFWNGEPEEKKIYRTASLGVSAIEFWGWRKKNLNSIRTALEKTGIVCCAFSCDHGFDLTKTVGKKFLTEAIKQSVQTARFLNCSRLIITSGNIVKGLSFARTRRRVIEQLKSMVKIAEDAGITILLEPLNNIVDHPGCWLTHMKDAVDIVNSIESPNLKILYDIYHQQITEGNIIDTITKHIHLIGHFHVAGVPGRGVPSDGELNYRAIFSAIRHLSYDGYIGLEYEPCRKEEQSLRKALELVQN